jgi:hypothetical protein
MLIFNSILNVLDFKAIPAHKLILSMRSSVFGKMFFYDGANGGAKNDGHIQVEEEA